MTIINKIKSIGIKECVNRILLGRIYPFLDKYLFLPISRLLWNKSELKDYIIIESHNDFDSNGGAFYDYLIDNKLNDKYKVIWFIVNKAPKKLPQNVICIKHTIPSFKKWYYLLNSKWIICGHYMFPSIKDKQISVYVTHGCPFFKDVKGVINVPDNMTYTLCSSNSFKEDERKQFSIKESKKDSIKVVGLPIDYILMNDSKGDLRKITSKEYNKVFLWAPTFRQDQELSRLDSSLEFPMGVPVIKDEKEYEKLNTVLRNSNSLLLIKIHPVQNLSRIKIKNMSNIIILDKDYVKENDIDNYRLMKDVDAMIGDYSSMSIEFLHLNRPIAYCLDDINEYKRGFWMKDPISFMAGHLIYEFKDLLVFINDVLDNNDCYKEKRSDLLKRTYDFNDEHSCKRLCELLGIK